MNRYVVQYSRAATKELDSLPIKLQERIISAVDALEENPRGPGSRKLKGSDIAYRIRVGRYRVIYEICDQEVVVLIVRIADRKDAYR